MDMNFTMQEVAQMLGEKDLLIASMDKQLRAANDRAEERLKVADEQFNKITELEKRLAILSKEK